MQRVSAIFFTLLLSTSGHIVPSVQKFRNLDVGDRPGVLRGSTADHDRYSGRNSQETTESSLKCYEQETVDSSSDKFVRCPGECPVVAEKKGDDVDCNFLCVEATQAACAQANPKETVPDVENGICRACIVHGCDKCARDGTDSCGECHRGYKLVDGKCEDTRAILWHILYVVLVLVALFMLGWIVDLKLRPITNAETVKSALAARSRAKLHQPRAQGQEGRPLWPLSTNLLREDVAGMGVLLQFNFAAAVIVWAFAVAIGWYILAQAVDTDLLILGTRRAKTARQNCILVAWGYETQHRLMWTKILFVAIVYAASCVMCFLLAVRQMRTAETIDQAESTHKDFAARIRGLPSIKGTEKVEEELQHAITQATGYSVVGVSVCWDFEEHEDDLMDLINCDLYLADQADRLQRGSIKDEVVDLPPDSNTLYARMERYLLHTDDSHAVPLRRQKSRTPKSAQMELNAKEVDVHGILDNLNTCADAYVVFQTEAARDAAVDVTTQKGGIEYRGKTLSLGRSRVEPTSVQWRNCANTNLWKKARRIASGTGLIAAGLGTWVVVFYLPFAWYSLTFDYSYGQEPGLVAGMAFSMIVVAGNQMMYFICSLVADQTRFIYVDDREVCYMLLFCFSCTFNVVLDLVTTYYVAYRISVGLGMKTYHGVKLADLTSFTEVFESYAIQRRLAENLWEYAFPSTFLIPFIIEPVVTVMVPYQLMVSIVARQPSIRGFLAESYLQGLVFDLSRYSDILLNIMIAVLIFFFPGGYNVQMFLAMALCHIFVYCLDQWRLLQTAQACCFAACLIDWWAQWVLCVALACLPACFVFKSNCEPGYHCLHGTKLVVACAAAFWAHILLHSLVLLFVVPLMQKDVTGDDAETAQYIECSESIAASWFSTNPIFCVRSEFLYEHNPPCKFYMPGKEHLLKKNPIIGCYFEDKVAETEDYDDLHSGLKDIHKAGMDVTKSVSETISRSFTAKRSDNQ